MTRIFLDTGPLRGVVWEHDKYHAACAAFFSQHPLEREPYFVCDTVKSEVARFLRRLEALPLDYEGRRQVKNMRKTITAYLAAMERLNYAEEGGYGVLVTRLHEGLKTKNSGGKEPNQENDAKIVAHALICAYRGGGAILATVDARDIGDNERLFNTIFAEVAGADADGVLTVRCLI